MCRNVREESRKRTETEQNDSQKYAYYTHRRFQSTPSTVDEQYHENRLNAKMRSVWTVFSDNVFLLSSYYYLHQPNGYAKLWLRWMTCCVDVSKLHFNLWSRAILSIVIKIEAKHNRSIVTHTHNRCNFTILQLLTAIVDQKYWAGVFYNSNNNKKPGWWFPETRSCLTIQLFRCIWYDFCGFFSQIEIESNTIPWDGNLLIYGYAIMSWIDWCQTKHLNESQTSIVFFLFRFVKCWFRKSKNNWTNYWLYTTVMIRWIVIWKLSDAVSTPQASQVMWKRMPIIWANRIVFSSVSRMEIE